MNLEEKNKLRETIINNLYSKLKHSTNLYCEARTKPGKPIRKFKEIFQHTDQKTIDTTKSLSSFISDNILWLWEDAKIDIILEEKNGYDCLFKKEPHEIKITGAKLDKNGLYVTVDSWTGNKFYKVPKLILIAYYLDFNVDAITKLFLAFVDLNNCRSIWSKGCSTANITNLEFKIEDSDEIKIIIGNKRNKRKYIKFLLEELKKY